jgi:hypothetical protein
VLAEHSGLRHILERKDFRSPPPRRADADLMDNSFRALLAALAATATRASRILAATPRLVCFVGGPADGIVTPHTPPPPAPATAFVCVLVAGQPAAHYAPLDPDDPRTYYHLGPCTGPGSL